LKYRNFATKIWNAARFVAEATTGNPKSQFPNPKLLDHAETEFFKKLEKLEQKNEKNFAALKLSVALEELYEFFWHDFADQFLEYEKTAIREAESPERVEPAKSCLLVALKRQLILLSDFAPFLVDTIEKEMLS
jgi:valyl-tRNA synthetase